MSSSLCVGLLLPFQRTCSSLVESALGDSQLPNQCWMVWARLYLSRNCVTNVCNHWRRQGGPRPPQSPGNFFLVKTVFQASLQLNPVVHKTQREGAGPKKLWNFEARACIGLQKNLDFINKNVRLVILTPFQKLRYYFCCINVLKIHSCFIAILNASLTINLNWIFFVKEQKYACKNWSTDPDFSRHGFSFSKHVRASRHVF